MSPEERAKLLGTICGGAVNAAKGLIQSFVDEIYRKNAEIEARDAEIRRLRTMIADHECSGVPFGEAYKRKPEPGKLTNIEWLYQHPEKLAETLFCPFEDCKYDEVPLDDGEDICYKCLLNWLKEEHTDGKKELND